MTDEATRAAVARMRAAADKASAEAQVHPDSQRAAYCDGTDHGLRTAMSMLATEHAKREDDRNAVTHVAAANDTLYASRRDGSTWRWWRGGERWEREYGPLPFGTEWVAV